jgi:hypothetical protein
MQQRKGEFVCNALFALWLEWNLISFQCLQIHFEYKKDTYIVVILKK